MVAGGEKVVDPFLEGGSGENGTRGLSQCPGIIQSHGGEIRFRAHQGTATFIVDLPLVRGAGDMTSSEIRRASSPLTVMLVDSDATGRRQLFGLLSLRGHRVVPVPLEEAADLCQRFRFDAVMWAIRPGGSRWGEFHERIRAHANAFVLVSDGYDPELARSLEESAGFLLGRPVKESELDAILAKIAALVPHES
jgi:CheY-like chemotaxis protein